MMTCNRQKNLTGLIKKAKTRRAEAENRSLQIVNEDFPPTSNAVIAFLNQER